MTADRSELAFECDLIMKGGITSGVVYPPAVVDVAVDHRLRSIGGSSAGAIAAAAAAAAELGRYSATGGFALLKALPRQLGTVDRTDRTLLRRLFQAQRSTADVYDLFWLSRSTKGKQRRSAIVGALAGHGAVPAMVDVVGVVAALITVALVALSASAGQAWGIITSALLLIVVIAVWVIVRKVARPVAGALHLARTIPSAVAANHHGLCNGRAPDGSADQGLTDWLHDTLQGLAGRNDPGLDDDTRKRPVTYGDLDTAGVRLVTMTTDLTRGTAEVFPLLRGGWAYDEADITALFPQAIVDHLAGTGKLPEHADRAAALAHAGLRPLPEHDDLPILIGARISLSFPLLLSAVPLYTWAPQRVDDHWEMRYVKCWFSDGGITSNLPVHLFDSPLPQRPTYAINLAGGGDAAAGCENIWRPTHTVSGRNPDLGSIESSVQFLSAVFDTMQNWSDNSLMRAPGYRDRICTVRLGTGEGGMNLDMPAATIDALAARGALAGDNLAWMQRGTLSSCPPPEGGDAEELRHQWERHKFTRYRTFLRGLGQYVDQAEHGFDGAAAYPQLARDAVDQSWYPYRSGWTEKRCDDVEASLRVIFAVDTAKMQTGAPAGAALGFNPRMTEPDDT
jgi:hypothetical protein